MANPTPPEPGRKRTLYDILGVDRDANAIDIGIAYKAKVAALDRDPGADQNESNLVHQAYQVLCMPNERAAYDAKLVSMAEKAAAKEAALREGAKGCTLSGAGPTIFSITDDRERAEAIGAAMAKAFQKEGLESCSLITGIDAEGARILP